MKTLMLFVLTIAAAVAADSKPKMTIAEHKAAAERHATRADEFATKAKKHEAAAERIKSNRGYNAMQHKWPALANGAESRERDRAMQARRAEAESRELVAFHTEMANKSVEAEP